MLHIFANDSQALVRSPLRSASVSSSSSILKKLVQMDRRDRMSSVGQCSATWIRDLSFVEGADSVAGRNENAFVLFEHAQEDDHKAVAA